MLRGNDGVKCVKHGPTTDEYEYRAHTLKLACLKATHTLTPRCYVLYKTASKCATKLFANGLSNCDLMR